MKFLSFALKITLLALLPVFTMTSCKDDDPTPTTATISGTITIENTELWNTWKDSGEVQLTLFPAFSLNPPAGWGDIPENSLFPGFPGGRFALGAPVNSQNPIIINIVPGQSIYNYELTVDPGTYSALAVGFRHDFITDPSLRTATLGVHHSIPDVVSSGLVIKIDIGGGQIITVINDPAPTPITVEAGDEVTINFKADLGFVEVWFQ
ncbi:MAG: hypothetical protein M3R25_14880 [Bacteroidota bacterium]|nr:hypothetical protein [Bacteroidota bacterium]